MKARGHFDEAGGAQLEEECARIMESINTDRHDVL